MNAVFEQATPRDLERVLVFIKAYYQFDRIPFRTEHLKRALDALLRNSRLGQVWIIRTEEQDVGYVVLTFGYDLELGGHHGTVPYRRPQELKP